MAAPAFEYVGHTLTDKDNLALNPNDLSTQALITTSHALVGGTIAELSGGEFSSGAVATAVGHVVGEYIKDRELENLDINNLPFDPSNPNSVQSYVNQLETETVAIASAVGGATVLLTQENVSDVELARATSLSSSVVENNGFGLITGTILLYVALTEYLQTPETESDIATGMPLSDLHPITAGADAIQTLVESGKYDEAAVLGMIAKKIPGVNADKAKDIFDSLKGKVKGYGANTMRPGHIGGNSIKINSDNAVRKFEVNDKGKMHLSNRDENVLDVVKDIGYDKDNLTKTKEILEKSIKARRSEKVIYGSLNKGHKDRIKIEEKALELVKSRLNEL